MMPAEVSMFPCRKFAAPLMFGTWPNISGSFRVSAVYGEDGTRRNAFYEASGVFSRGDSTIQDGSVQNGTYTLLSSVCSINLSRSSNIYASGNNVQAPAIQCLPCIKC